MPYAGAEDWEGQIKSDPDRLVWNLKQKLEPMQFTSKDFTLQAEYLLTVNLIRKQREVEEPLGLSYVQPGKNLNLDSKAEWKGLN